MAETLWKIDPGNEKAITTLVELIEAAEDEDTRSEVVSILGEIGTGNDKAINVLVELIQNECYEDHIVAESLGKIDPGNEIVQRLSRCYLALRPKHELSRVSSGLA